MRCDSDQFDGSHQFINCSTFGTNSVTDSIIIRLGEERQSLLSGCYHRLGLTLSDPSLTYLQRSDCWESSTVREPKPLQL